MMMMGHNYLISTQTHMTTMNKDGTISLLLFFAVSMYGTTACQLATSNRRIAQPNVGKIVKPLDPLLVAFIVTQMSRGLLMVVRFREHAFWPELWKRIVVDGGAA
jgi:hypothetical protein